MLVIETKLSLKTGALLEIRLEPKEGLKNAVDYEAVMVPTAGAVRVLAQLFGYQVGQLAYADGPLGKYRHGIMRAFVCSKTFNPVDDHVFRLETSKELRRIHEERQAVVDRQQSG